VTYAGACHDSDNRILTLVFAHELPRFKLIFHKLSQSLTTVRILIPNEEWVYSRLANPPTLKKPDTSALNYTEEAVRGTLAKASALLAGAAIDTVIVYIECNYGFPSDSIFPLYIRDNSQLKAIIGEYVPTLPEMIMVATSSNAEVVHAAASCFKLQHDDDRVLDKSAGPLAVADIYQKTISRKRATTLTSGTPKQANESIIGKRCDVDEPSSISTHVSKTLKFSEPDAATQRYAAPAAIDPDRALVETSLVNRQSFDNIGANRSSKGSQILSNSQCQKNPRPPSVPVVELSGGCCSFFGKRTRDIQVGPDQGNELDLSGTGLALNIKRSKPAFQVSG
jgi:hypothetical protein